MVDTRQLEQDIQNRLDHIKETLSKLESDSSQMDRPTEAPISQPKPTPEQQPSEANAYAYVGGPSDPSQPSRGGQTTPEVPANTGQFPFMESGPKEPPHQESSTSSSSPGNNADQSYAFVGATPATAPQPQIPPQPEQTTSAKSEGQQVSTPQPEPDNKYAFVGSTPQPNAARSSEPTPSGGPKYSYPTYSAQELENEYNQVKSMPSWPPEIRAKFKNSYPYIDKIGFASRQIISGIKGDGLA